MIEPEWIEQAWKSVAQFVASTTDITRASLVFPHELDANWSGSDADGDLDLEEPAEALAFLFNHAWGDAYPLVFLEWGWGFRETASFVRLRLTDEVGAYLASISVSDAGEPTSRLVAASRNPSDETDRLFLDAVFAEGGEPLGIFFMYNAPSDVRFNEKFTHAEIVDWLVAGLATGVGDPCESVLENVEDPWEWDGWPPEEPAPPEPTHNIPPDEIDAKRLELGQSIEPKRGMYARWNDSVKLNEALEAWALKRDPTYKAAIRSYRREYKAWEKRNEKTLDQVDPEFSRHLMGRYATEFLGIPR